MTTEEYHKLNEIAHSRIEDNFCDTTARIEVKMDKIASSIEKVDNCLHGNGSEGMKTIIAKHEQTLTTFKKAVWVIFTVLAGVAVAAML